MNSGLDVIYYVFLLPIFIMKTNLERRQRLEHHSDIHLRPASHTQMQIRKFQINKLLNQLQDLLADGWSSWKIGAFIETVDDDINLALSWQTRHIRQTFFQRVNVGFLHAATVV